MARMIGGTGTIIVIPGVSAALVAHWRRFGARWDSTDALARADAAEAGQPVEVGYETLLSAMCRARLDRHLGRLDQGARYVITGPDRLIACG